MFSGVCWLTSTADSLGISSPAVAKLLGLFHTCCCRKLSCLLSLNVAAQAQQSKNFFKLCSGEFMTSICLSVVQEPGKNWKKPWPWGHEGVCMQELNPILGFWRSPVTWVGLGAFTFVSFVRWLKLISVCPVCGDHCAGLNSVIELVWLGPGLKYPRSISVYAAMELTS